jgi:hypothetical protein
MNHPGLECKYGVVRFAGSLHRNTRHELVFQSNDALEAMQQLEVLCRTDDVDHGHMLAIKNNEQ